MTAGRVRFPSRVAALVPPPSPHPPPSEKNLQAALFSTCARHPGARVLGGGRSHPLPRAPLSVPRACGIAIGRDAGVAGAGRGQGRGCMVSSRPPLGCGDRGAGLRWRFAPIYLSWHSGPAPPQGETGRDGAGGGRPPAIGERAGRRRRPRPIMLVSPLPGPLSGP